MQKATHEELVNLEIGHPVIVNIKDQITDIAIFLGYNKDTHEITVVDSMLNKNSAYYPNIYKYKECIIVSLEKDNLLKLLQKKM